MKLTSLKIFALKLALFSSMLAYMAFDLFLWEGPLWSALHKKDSSSTEATAAPVARVYGESISADQFARHIAEQSWLRSADAAQLTPGQRTVMLMELVRSTILRMRARYNDKNLPDFAAEAEAEVQRLASRAKSPEAFEQALTEQGYTRQSFTQKLQAIMKASALLDRAVSPFCEVKDEDVAKHYELLKDELQTPARRPLKHIFLATLDKDSESVRAQAQALLQELEQGADFAQLARTHSEDYRTATLGGDLGAVQDDENFPLRELPIFGENAAPTGKPVLAQSRWGWHILLAGEEMPARQLSLDEARESLRTAIQSAQYELSIKNYFDQAIRDGFRKQHLSINHAN